MQLLTPALGLIFWTALIFLVVLFLLKKYAWKPILDALDEREHTIDDALKTAERTRQEMVNLKSEHEALLMQAKQERMNIIREANQIKEQIVTDARDKAKEEASRIMKENLLEIDNRKMEAITDLKNQVGDMVLQISEKILRRELSDKPKQEDYIKQLINETKLN